MARTELQKEIGAKWFLSLKKLAEQAGVPCKTVEKAVQGETILPRYEEKLRAFLAQL